MSIASTSIAATPIVAEGSQIKSISATMTMVVGARTGIVGTAAMAGRGTIRVQALANIGKVFLLSVMAIQAKMVGKAVGTATMAARFTSDVQSLASGKFVATMGGRVIALVYARPGLIPAVFLGARAFIQATARSALVGTAAMTGKMTSKISKSAGVIGLIKLSASMAIQSKFVPGIRGLASLLGQMTAQVTHQVTFVPKIFLVGMSRAQIAFQPGVRGIASMSGRITSRLTTIPGIRGLAPLTGRLASQATGSLSGFRGVASMATRMATQVTSGTGMKAVAGLVGRVVGQVKAQPGIAGAAKLGGQLVASVKAPAGISYFSFMTGVVRSATKLRGLQQPIARLSGMLTQLVEGRLGSTGPVAYLGARMASMTRALGGQRTIYLQGQIVAMVRFGPSGNLPATAMVWPTIATQAIMSYTITVAVTSASVQG